MGERRSFPRLRRAGDKPSLVLMPDDLAILRHVHRHRFIRADDLYRLLDYRSPDRLSRRLTQLFRAEYLDRPPSQVDRLEPGSRALVYGLGNAGARALKEQAGVAIGPTDWRARNRTYTRENLDHTLAVTSFMTALEIACRARSDLSLIRLEDMLDQAPEATKQAVFPGKWSVPLSFSAYRADVQIAPDAIFGLRHERPEGARRSFVFVEVDRGTMTIAPAERIQHSEAFLYRATVLRKLFTYAESHQRALHKERFGIPAARVLILTTAPGRAAAMQQAAARFVLRRTQTPVELFLFGSLGRENPLEAIYRDGSGKKASLVPPMGITASA